MKYLLIILFIACEKPVASPNSLETIFEKLTTTYEVDYYNELFVNTSRPIIGAANTWQLLFSMKTLNIESTHHKYCVLYKIPSKDKKGILKITEVKILEKCTNDHRKDTISYFDAIEKLQITFINQEGWYLSFTVNDTIQKVPLLNIHDPLRKLTTANSSASNKIDIGITYIADERGEKNFLSALGGWSDDFADGKATPCFRVDDKCKPVGRDLCQRCRFGWYTTVGQGCQKNNKYCGIDRCGEKGWPACARGIMWSKQKEIDPCFHSDKVSFCQNDLIPQCNENNELICL